MPFILATYIAGQELRVLTLGKKQTYQILWSINKIDTIIMKFWKMLIKQLFVSKKTFNKMHFKSNNNSKSLIFNLNFWGNFTFSCSFVSFKFSISSVSDEDDVCCFCLFAVNLSIIPVHTPWRWKLLPSPSGISITLKTISRILGSSRGELRMQNQIWAVLVFLYIFLTSSKQISIVRMHRLSKN